jgi:hypothetical protein
MSGYATSARRHIGGKPLKTTEVKKQKQKQGNGVRGGGEKIAKYDEFHGFSEGV